MCVGVVRPFDGHPKVLTRASPYLRTMGAHAQHLLHHQPHQHPGRTMAVRAGVAKRRVEAGLRAAVGRVIVEKAIFAVAGEMSDDQGAEKHESLLERQKSYGLKFLFCPFQSPHKSPPTTHTTHTHHHPLAVIGCFK